MSPARHSRTTKNPEYTEASQRMRFRAFGPVIRGLKFWNWPMGRLGKVRSARIAAGSHNHGLGAHRVFE